MIGDGMGLTQITAGWIAKKDALNLERCEFIGLMKTNSSDNLITDSAAGATAFSTGKKTYNGAIGVDPDTISQPTILEIAEKNGIATGLVATASITHATPASFIAHQPSRALDEAIATDFLKTDIDVFIGGGKKFFETRTDGENLLDKLKENGYKIADGSEEIASVKTGKLAGFIADEQPAKFSEGRGAILTTASLKAIELLNQHDKGFFLMIEGSQIDWGGHANDSKWIIDEMIDFDNAVGKVLDFAEKNGNTLVIITADHETGGYAINKATEDGTIEGAFTTDYHTATMVPVFAYGPGAEAFAGVYHNTAIFDKMLKAFNLNE
ncbi:MAG: alkaline phosphatase [Marinobacter sp.]|nr:MAG: alkaline phosphatase [Marinobacter sp.]